MDKTIYYNYLYDYYGSLLTDIQRSYYEDYYFKNLSLSEIAEEKNISRAAVHKTVSNVIDKLNYYESILHIHDNMKKLKECLELSDVSLIKEKINEIIEK